MGITFGFTSNVFDIGPAIIFTFLNLLFFALAFYINTLFIFPKYYDSNNVKRYVFVTLIIIAILSVTYVLSESGLMVIHDIELPKHISNPKKHLVFMFIRIFFWLIFIVSTGSFFLVQTKLREHEKINKQVSEEKLNTELKLLKAQINPHFLFNALNNIYSLSYMKSENAPGSVLKLSGMLRYVIEDCKDETVSLKSEIEYIENYISFQNMKTADEMNIHFNYEKADKQLKVSPLLMIPFIENSFKYSKIEEFPNAYIKIEIETPSKDVVNISVMNSVPPTAKAKAGSGTGIDNVKQRLQILYPGKHELSINEHEDKFEVLLKIKLS